MGTVYAFIKRITECLKNKHPGITYVHYITDSSTSHYRNKNTMYLVANHVRLFVFESGSRLRTSNGLGGFSKRFADLAVKRQTASAEDYYNWGKSLANSQTKYSFVPNEECDEAYNELLAVNPRVHCNCIVYFRWECLTDGKFKASCNGCIKHNIVQHIGKSNETDMRTDIQNEPEVILDQARRFESVTSFTENEFVAVIYNDYLYIGKVVKYDHSDDELPLQDSFMEHA
ncbi:LOW QUALITY PROTEIN: hypothetical protein MAR_026329, partial [Mya arenaria]